VADPEFIVLSFFVRIDDCQSTIPHHRWVEAVRDAAGPSAWVSPTFSLPHLVALEVRSFVHDSRATLTFYAV
jgi:hypothetical protein